jgi:ATP-binding cassette subfamily B protein
MERCATRTARTVSDDRELSSVAWPGARAGEAIAALARQAGIPTRTVEVARSSNVEAGAAWLGLEAQAVSCLHAEAHRFVRSAAPALLPIGGDRWLALVRARGSDAIVVDVTGRERRVAIASIRAALARPAEARVRAGVEKMVSDAGIAPRRRDRTVRSILEGQLGGTLVDAGFIVRLPPGADFRRQLRDAGVGKRLATMVLTHAARYALIALSWWIIGSGALSGRLDVRWMGGWALALLAQVPLFVATSWLQGRVAIDAGSLLKRRLLAGALAMPPDAMRLEGAGHLLGRVLEAESVEALTLGAGFAALTASIELLVGGVILVLGAGGALQAAALALWVTLSAIVARRYLHRRRAWTEARLSLTHALVERMIGHRTRLAQEPRERWHEHEDCILEQYVERGAAMDRSEATLRAFIPRGWLVLAMSILAPAFFRRTTTTAELAIAIGGSLLAYGALQSLTSGLAAMNGALIAWRSVEPIYLAAGEVEGPSSPALRDLAPPTSLAARDVVFRHTARGEPALNGASLQVRTGDRILLQGRSGGGKSTLGAVLAGLRRPQSGLVLLGGLDLPTLGVEGWRRHVVAAPQFHENHVFSGTFGFNLLLGREWPPSEDDLERARVVCDELGLTPLLRKMPSGLGQAVGETGWQLSHGERSRLFVARALLQEPECLVIDESYGALDPETLRLALGCVLRRAKSLVLIAHP